MKIQALSGEDNKGMEFLDVAMTKVEDLTCCKFCEAAVDLKRPDIKKFLMKKLKSDGTLDELKLDDKTTLASMLSKTAPAVKNWRHFADKFNLKEDKKAIENCNNKGNTPTRDLLRRDDAFTEMSLSELKQRCQKHKFKEVVNVIQKIINSK